MAAWLLNSFTVTICERTSLYYSRRTLLASITAVRNRVCPPRSTPTSGRRGRRVVGDRDPGQAFSLPEDRLQETCGRRIPAQRGSETGASSIRVTRLLFPPPFSPLQALLEVFIDRIACS